MRTLVLAVLWIATVAGAYVLGGARPAAAPGPADVALPAERRPAAALRGIEAPSPREAAPTTARPGSGPATGASEGLAAGERAGPGSEEAGAPFDLEGVTTPDEAFDRLMRHVAALLARGEAGHLELLAFLDQDLVRGKELKRLFGSEEEAMRFLYPAIQFLVRRDAQVVDLTETVFRTMATNPQAFAAFDDDTLEVFTEGVGVLLPGAVDDERMARFRGYATAILEAPEGTQPEAVTRNRRRVERLMGYWAPRLGPEEAKARLESGQASAQEVMGLLKRLPADQRAGLDLGALLAPVVASGDYRAMQVLRQVAIEPRDVTLLDRAAIEGLVGGKLNEWTFHQYLDATGRGSWPAAQPLLEVALSEGEPARSAAVMTLRRLAPPKDYVAWVLESYDLPEATRERLTATFGLER